MSEYPRIRVLEYIVKHQPVAVTTMGKELEMSIGSLYHHLTKLRHVLEQDTLKRYRLSPWGRTLLERYEGNYEGVCRELDEEPYDGLIIKSSSPIAKSLLSLMKKKKLITEVRLPKKLSRKERKFLRITPKGYALLRKYKELLATIE